MAPGVLTQLGVRIIHSELTSMGEDALCLFDDHSAVQSVLQLLDNHVPVGDGAACHHNDTGHMSEGLTQFEVIIVKSSDIYTEEPERDEHVVAQPHWYRMDGGEPSPAGRRHELWPTALFAGEVGHTNGIA